MSKPRTGRARRTQDVGRAEGPRRTAAGTGLDRDLIPRDLVAARPGQVEEVLEVEVTLGILVVLETRVVGGGRKEEEEVTVLKNSSSLWCEMDRPLRDVSLKSASG